MVLSGMNVSVETIEQLNITVVYDRIPLKRLSRDRLRSMIPESSPQLIDLPQVISVVLPDVGLLCVIDEKRVQCNDAGDCQVGDRPLARLAWRAAEVVEDHARQIAYGLNFRVTGTVNYDAPGSRPFL